MPDHNILVVIYEFGQDEGAVHRCQFNGLAENMKMDLLVEHDLLQCNNFSSRMDIGFAGKFWKKEGTKHFRQKHFYIKCDLTLCANLNKSNFHQQCLRR